MSENTFDQTLDVKGLKCPMPMLKTKKALAKMEPGQTLLVLATDPHAVRDLSQFADQTGNKMLSFSCRENRKADSHKRGEIICLT